MAATTTTQTPAPEGSGLGMDARLDQETAQWLRWDRVRADLRLPGSRAPRLVRQGAGPSFLPSLPHYTEPARRKLLWDWRQLCGSPDC